MQYTESETTHMNISVHITERVFYKKFVADQNCITKICKNKKTEIKWKKTKKVNKKR